MVNFEQGMIANFLGAMLKACGWITRDRYLIS